MLVDELYQLVNTTNKDHRYYGLFLRRQNQNTANGGGDVRLTLDEDEGVWLKDGRQLKEYNLTSMGM